MSTLTDLLDRYADNKLAIALGGLIGGALLTLYFPAIWSLFVRLIMWIGRRVGGRFSRWSFQGRYLDWMVAECRELKLTGIVSHDAAKKPRLEQVFLSLRMGRDRSPGTDDDRDEPKRHLVRTWAEFFEMLSFQRKNVSSQQQRKRVQTLLSDARAFQRSIRSRRTSKSGAQSITEEAAVASFLSANADELEDAIGGVQLRMILREQQRIAILGKPGAGKSTLLQHIALALAKEKAADPKLRHRGAAYAKLGYREWRLPILIRLSSIATLIASKNPQGNDPSILDVLPRILPPDLQKDPVATKYFAEQLRRGRCLVLFDGLDEVPTDQEFNAVVHAIKSLTLSYAKNQYVVTSRIAGWRGGVGSDFDVSYVNDLSDRQVQTFIDSWYEAVEKNAVVGRLQDEGHAESIRREHQYKQRASDLKTTLRENIGIRRLATNPMLLSIIALVHRSLATLPKERSKLYAECSKIFLEQWDISRGIRVDDTGLKLEQKEAIMKRLAWAYHVGEIGDKAGGREATRKEVEGMMQELLPSLGRTAEDANHLLDMLIERSGILTERRRGVLSFSHHTFQEYFAAQYIATDSNRDHSFLLAPSRLATDWWHEVILLYSGLVPDSSDLLDSIHSLPDDDLVRTKLRLAMLCLGESIGVDSTDIRREIICDVVALRAPERAPMIPPRIEVMDYLTRWARGRHWYPAAAKASVRSAEPHNATRVRILVLDALRSSDDNIRVAAMSSLTSLSGELDEDFISAIMSCLSDVDSTSFSRTLTTISALLRSRKLIGVEIRKRIEIALEPLWNSKKFERDLDFTHSLVDLVVALDVPESLCRKLKDLLISRWEHMAGSAILTAISKSEKFRSIVFSDEFIQWIMDDARSIEIQGWRSLVLGSLNREVAVRVDAVGSLDALLRRHSSDGEDRSITRALGELASHGMHEEVGKLVDVLISSRDTKMRILGMEIIGFSDIDIWSPARRSAVLSCLENGNKELATAACKAVAVLLGHPDCDTDIVSRIIALATGSHEVVRIAALRALGAVTATQHQAQLLDAALGQLANGPIAVATAAAVVISKVAKVSVTEAKFDELVVSVSSLLDRITAQRQGVRRAVRRLLPGRLVYRASHLALESFWNTLIKLACLSPSETAIDRLIDISTHTAWPDLGSSRVFSEMMDFHLLSTPRGIEFIRHDNMFDSVLIRVTDLNRLSDLTMISTDGLFMEMDGSAYSSDVVKQYAQRMPSQALEAKVLRLLGIGNVRAKYLGLLLLTGATSPISEAVMVELTGLLASRNAHLASGALHAISEIAPRNPSERWTTVLVAGLAHDDRLIQDGAWRVLEEVCATRADRRVTAGMAT